MRSQARLMRLLDEGVAPAVSWSRGRALDIRLICSAERLPHTAVLAGTFREDMRSRTSTAAGPDQNQPQVSPPTPSNLNVCHYGSCEPCIAVNLLRDHRRRRHQDDGRTRRIPTPCWSRDKHRALTCQFRNGQRA
jgi:hypothetical protein